MSKKKEPIKFIISGVLAVATDLAIYYILSTLISNNTAKAISFISGTIVAYLLNKYWTFEKKEWNNREVLSFLILYLISLTVNVTVNKGVLSIDDNMKLLAFLVATGFSATLNFIGQKFWIFK